MKTNKGFNEKTQQEWTTHEFEVGDKGMIKTAEVSENQRTNKEGEKYFVYSLKVQDFADNQIKWVKLTKMQAKQAKKMQEKGSLENRRYEIKSFTITDDKTGQPKTLPSLNIKLSSEEFDAMKKQKAVGPQTNLNSKMTQTSTITSAAATHGLSGLFKAQKKSWPEDVQQVINLLSTVHKEHFMKNLVETEFYNGKITPRAFINEFLSTTEITSQLTEDQIIEVWNEIVEKIGKGQ